MLGAMKTRRERIRDRRRARRGERDAEFARADARALAINPRLWGFSSLLRATQALIARPATRGPTLWVTGLVAALALAWALAVWLV